MSEFSVLNHKFWVWGCLGENWVLM